MDKVEKYMKLNESEDGVMTYFTGRGNYTQAIRYGNRPKDLSRVTRLRNLQHAKEILAAEGVLTDELDRVINETMRGI